MPDLPNGATITSATLNVLYYFDSGVTGGMYVTAHVEEADWDENCTWNHMSYDGQDPTMDISPTVLSSTYLGANTFYPQLACINITSAAQSWYDGNIHGYNNNYGIALKHQSGNSLVYFHSSEANNGFTPYFQITYKVINGVYALGKADGNVYAENRTVSGFSFIYQETFSSPPTSAEDRKYLFKIAYRAETDDYIIRSMLNNEIIIYPSIVDNAPMSRRVTISGVPATDSNLPAQYAWKIAYTPDDGYKLYYKDGDTTYYMRGVFDLFGTKTLELTTNSNASGIDWDFYEYTGDPIDGIGRYNFKQELILGESYEHKAYVYSSTVGRNGPAIYSSDDTNILTIGYSSGELTANGPGSTNIWVSYSGAPYRWGKTATVCNQYFLKSSHSYMTSASNVEGATVKATEFNGNIEQMWVFVYQGEGYYFIRDRKSGNYLTAPNNDLEGSVVSQRLTSDLYLDRQLWKIVYRNSTTGSYRLQAKAREIDGSNLYLGYSGDKIVQSSNTIGTYWHPSYVQSSSISAEGQQMSMWCWAASSRMFTNHYYTVPSSRTQSTAVTAIKGQISNSSGTTEEAIKAVGHYYSNDINSNALNLVQDSGAIFSEEILLRFLDDNNVVYIARGWYDSNNNRDGGHTYVIYGYTKEFINNETQINFLIRNPTPPTIPDNWENVPVQTVGTTKLWLYTDICNGQINNIDDGIWDKYVVVSTDYSSDTISPVFN